MPSQPDLDRPVKAVAAGDIPRDAVLATLHQVVASEAFGKSDRAARFLRYLVETALRGEAPLLKENVLGVEVFDRPATWDPRLDPIVRQEAGRLRKRLAKYYENGGAPAEIRIELPVGTYVPVFRRQPAPIEPAPAQSRAPEHVPAARSRVWYLHGCRNPVFCRSSHRVAQSLFVSIGALRRGSPLREPDHMRRMSDGLATTAVNGADP